MTVLRISSYHAAKIPCFSETQPHKMSFYRYFVIICEGNERAGQGGEEKDISRRDCASSWGLACPSRISFSTSCSLRKHVSFPWPGKQPFFRPNTSRSTAWPGNRPFSGRTPREALLGWENSLFSGRTPRAALLGRENSLFPGRSCHKVPFPLDRLWFFARLSTQSWLSLDGGSAGDRCVERIRAGARSGR